MTFFFTTVLLHAPNSTWHQKLFNFLRIDSIIFHLLQGPSSILFLDNSFFSIHQWEIWAGADTQRWSVAQQPPLRAPTDTSERQFTQDSDTDLVWAVLVWNEFQDGCRSCLTTSFPSVLSLPQHENHVCPPDETVEIYGETIDVTWHNPMWSRYVKLSTE